MAELREQMKTKETLLKNEYRDISNGIFTKSDDVKLKAMEENHKTRIEIASKTFRLVCKFFF